MNKSLAISITIMLLIVSSAWADWNEGDPYKMHWPQRPDPEGWDVACSDIAEVTPAPLADDFQCSRTGPITGIHIWASVKDGDMPHSLAYIHVAIHQDIPDPDGDGELYSMPGEVLWERDVTIYPDYQTRQILSPSWQGWFDPVTGQWEYPDHQNFWQYNITIPEADAYEQQEGTIYWLSVWMVSDLNQMIGTGPIGWKELPGGRPLHRLCCLLGRSQQPMGSAG